MTSLDLLTIFGGIENQYLLEAQTLRSRTSPAHRLHWKRAIIMLAAVVALMTLLCGTAMAVSTDFREYVFDIFGFFFPPKTVAIVIDGTEEEIRYSSLGEVPDETGLGFAIYTVRRRIRTISLPFIFPNPSFLPQPRDQEPSGTENASDSKAQHNSSQILLFPGGSGFVR